MLGRSYKIGRHIGRMTLDSRQRMTNSAEVGLGMVGVGIFLIMFLGLIYLIF